MSERLHRAIELLREVHAIVNDEIGDTDGAVLRRAEQSVAHAIDAIERALDDREACA